MSVDRAAVLAWVTASCSAQGVPLVVTDAGVIATVGVLLNGGGSARKGAPAPAHGGPSFTGAKSR